MDALDMRILREMGMTPFARGPRSLEALQPSTLARSLGTTRQTVESRLAKLQDAGVLEGFAIWPNLRHLGLRWDVYHWRVLDAARKSRVFAELPLEEGVVGVYTFLGPDLCVDLATSTDQEREALLARVSAATGGAGPFTLYARPMPPVRRELTPLDWRILRALRPDPRRALAEVATEAGVSARTVKRHIERMSREAAFDVTARVSLARSPYPLPLALLVHFTPEGGRRTAAELLRIFDDRCVEAWVPTSAELGNWDMSLYAASPADIEKLRGQAEAVPHVARVEVLLYTGARMDDRWLDREIERRASA